MTRAAVLVVVLMGAVGCAAHDGAGPPSSPAAERLRDPVGRMAVVVSGETRFSLVEHSSEPGRTLAEIVKWTPYRALLLPLVPLVHEGITGAVASDQQTTIGARLRDLTPRQIVATQLAQRLEASGRFGEIVQFDREPVGEERRRTDALLRLTVPRWGMVQVREGVPGLVSAFADVRAQLVARETGVVLWTRSEDVTHPDRLPLGTFASQRDLARAELVEVLERAGHRLASELLYAWTVNR